MRLDEDKWVFAGGVTPEWNWVADRRRREALAKLEAVDLSKAPPGKWRAGLDYLLKTPGPERDRLLLDPAMDYWLYLWDKHFASAPASESDWRLQLSLLQGFAAALAKQRGDPLDFEAWPDPAGRFYLYGSPWWAEAPKGPFNVSRLELRRLPELRPGLIVDEQAWLLVHGVTMHGLGKLNHRQLKRFIEVLSRSIEELRDVDPLIEAELLDMTRLIVPLATPEKQSSVSSSYVSLRGAICLSHAESTLLQAETLIHEFCHQKMNQLLAVDPLLLPGQGGQVFYSPWRPDARRLRGLLLGAHAFLNVARHLLAAISRRSFRKRENIDTMLNVALRLYQVEDALRSLFFYARFTEFGLRFTLALQRELGVLHHGTLWFPKALIKEARAATQRHRAKFALHDTGFHKSAAFVDRVKKAPFLSPGGVEA